jgi:hypothetical protein
MATVTPQPQQQQPEPHRTDQREELRIYSHSELFYWWPVWAVGYLMAAITYLDGRPIQFAEGGPQELVHPSQAVGVVYTVVVFLTILITNVTLRGLASVVAIISLMFLVLLFAYFGWWDEILRWLPHISVHMNMGFYIFFSTLMFIVWAGATFIYDRMSYWIIRPGQIVHEFVVGGAEKSYDTHGMVFEKVRNDLFKHWILGLGSGDLRIHTMGAKREELYVPHVLFVDWKVEAIQKMIATRPSEFTAPAVR